MTWRRPTRALLRTCGSLFRRAPLVHVAGPGTQLASPCERATNVVAAAAIGSGRHPLSAFFKEFEAPPSCGSSPGTLSFSNSGALPFRSAIHQGVGICDLGLPSRGYATKGKKGKVKQSPTDDEEDDFTPQPKKGGRSKAGSSLPGGSLEAVLESTKELMEASIDSLARDLAKLRTGRASAGMLDHVTVEAYGASVPLSRIATVSVRDSQSLSVSLHDPNLLSAVEQGILQSPMGLNPTHEGTSLSVPVPRLTQEIRQAMVKLVVKAGETAKVSLRRARKEGLDEGKKLSESVSEDVAKRHEKVIQDLTNKYTKQVEDVCRKKEKEITSG